MQSIRVKIIIAVFLIGMLVVAGCVAPPDDTKTSTTAKSKQSGKDVKTTTTGDSGVLAEATPFQAAATSTTPGFSKITEATPLPEDIVCLVEFTNLDARFISNQTAKKITLNNPPMYINYTITEPFNTSGTKTVTQHGVTKEVEYEYYAPWAYLEITARDPVSGEIYNQDGFGKSYGYMTNKTVQIKKTGDMLIEFNGNNVTSTIGIWVKPVGNINTSIVNTSAMECRPQAEVKVLFQ